MPVLLLLVLGTGCTTVHGVRPVGDGALRVEGSLGGPLTEVYGAPIPLPFSGLGATWGLDDKTDLHAAWHPSAALFFNLFGADLGASREFLGPEGARPRLMGDLTLTVAGGDNEPGSPEGAVRVWAQPTLNASWDWGRKDRQTVYLGLTAFVEPAPEFHVLPALVVGEWWGIGRFTATTEFKWISPTQSSYDLTPRYYAPGNLGAISFQLGAAYTFGGPAR